MENVYHILDATLAPGLLLGIALCFIFLYIPPKTHLQNYRKARFIMAAAYTFYALCIALEYYVFNSDDNSMLAQPVILFIACFQAFLFTYTLISLIRLNFVTLKKILLEIASITLVSAAIILTYTSVDEDYTHKWAFVIFAIFYVSLLGRYIFIFRQEYKQFEQQMDNYFSDTGPQRLQWVKRSFYASLAVGILALIYAFVPTPIVGIAFISIVIIYYTSFGIRFINYALYFETVETAITSETEFEQTEVTTADQELMQRIDELMANDNIFRKADLTINDIAERLGERARVVSSVISKCRNINFKTYINRHRINEAKQLLDEDKNNIRTIDAIAAESGFSHRSSFYRVFKQLEGISPSDYRISK